MSIQYVYLFVNTIGYLISPIFLATLRYMIPSAEHGYKPELQAQKDYEVRLFGSDTILGFQPQPDQHDNGTMYIRNIGNNGTATITHVHGNSVTEVRLASQDRYAYEVTPYQRIIIPATGWDDKNYYQESSRHSVLKFANGTEVMVYPAYTKAPFEKDTAMWNPKAAVERLAPPGSKLAYAVWERLKQQNDQPLTEEAVRFYTNTTIMLGTLFDSLQYDPQIIGTTVPAQTEDTIQYLASQIGYLEGYQLNAQDLLQHLNILTFGYVHEKTSNAEPTKLMPEHQPQAVKLGEIPPTEAQGPIMHGTISLLQEVGMPVENAYYVTDEMLTKGVKAHAQELLQHIRETKQPIVIYLKDRFKGKSQGWITGFVLEEMKAIASEEDKILMSQYIKVIDDPTVLLFPHGDSHVPLAAEASYIVGFDDIVLTKSSIGESIDAASSDTIQAIDNALTRLKHDQASAKDRALLYHVQCYLGGQELNGNTDLSAIADMIKKKLQARCIVAPEGTTLDNTSDVRPTYTVEKQDADVWPYPGFGIVASWKRVDYGVGGLIASNLREKYGPKGHWFLSPDAQREPSGYRKKTSSRITYPYPSLFESLIECNTFMLGFDSPTNPEEYLIEDI